MWGRAVSLTVGAFLCAQPLAAAIIPSEPPAPDRGAQRGDDRNTAQHALELRIVEQRLRDLGLRDDHIADLLPQLSETALHDFAQHPDRMMIGGQHPTESWTWGDTLLAVWVAVAVVVVLVVFL